MRPLCSLDDTLIVAASQPRLQRQSTQLHGICRASLRFSKPTPVWPLADVIILPTHWYLKEKLTEGYTWIDQ